MGCSIDLSRMVVFGGGRYSHPSEIRSVGLRRLGQRRPGDTLGEDRRNWRAEAERERGREMGYSLGQGYEWLVGMRYAA